MQPESNIVTPHRPRLVSGSSTPLLTSHQKLVTSDVEEATTVIGRALTPFSMRVDGPQLAARLNSLQLDQIGLYYLDYGSTVQILPQETDDFYLVQFPLAGTSTVKSGPELVRNDAGTGSVLSPSRGFFMHWYSGTPHVILRIDRAALETHLTTLLGHRPDSPLRFDLRMDLRAPSIVAFRSVLDMLLHEVESHSAVMAFDQMRSLLLSRLLLAQPNSSSEALHSDISRVPSRLVRTAVEIIENRAGEPITVEQVAADCGVGLRALQLSFREHLEVTPSQYLRQVRLRKAAEELARSDSEETSVADVAMRWGFIHQGRFAAYYKAEFGETPSATLRSSRRGHPLLNVRQQ